MLTQAPQANHHFICPFMPLPWQIAPWRDISPRILLTGSAGGGKSKLAAEKIHGFMLKYPNATGLMVRKARESMTNSTVLFIDRKVIGGDPRVRHYPSKNRFEYWNGSVLAYGGMNDEQQRQQIRSIGQDGGLDILWVEEATALLEADYNELLPRMRGKAALWRQMLFTTNPDTPLHWIYRRLIQGKEASVYYSQAKDNPYNPADYQDTLGQLTGTDKDRLVDGKWVQATGLVYDVWSDGPSDGNVTEAADYVKDGGPVFWAVDDGYVGKLDQATQTFTADSHPRVFLLVQQRANGVLCAFAESYKVETLDDAHIADVLAMPYPLPEYAAVDKSAAALKGRLHAADIYTKNGPASVDESIKVFRPWLAKDKNGVRRFFVHPRCKHLRSEMAAYRRDANGNIVKAFDHGPDAARYVVWTLRYEQ